MIYTGIDKIQGGVFYGEKAVKSAFGKNKEKESKYLKLLNKIDQLVEEIAKVAGIFKRESEKKYRKNKSMTYNVYLQE
ncbi:MAG: hypothetical protein IT420_01820 [Candidatus Brocadia sp.]|nr:hypothetical protein [Candidatus Brocadia sp.]MDG5995634.1 hypothetical protein [Candidatus Brocadia sp.]